jgi:hypothetical protein
MKNTKYYISVGEPWDFESLDGQNIIKGKILSSKGDNCLIFKSKHLLNFGDINGDILILSPRCIDKNFKNIEDRVDINGGLLLEEFNDNLTEKELKDKSKFVIIGSINKVLP